MRLQRLSGLLQTYGSFLKTYFKPLKLCQYYLHNYLYCFCLGIILVLFAHWQTLKLIHFPQRLKSSPLLALLGLDFFLVFLALHSYRCTKWSKQTTIKRTLNFCLITEEDFVFKSVMDLCLSLYFLLCCKLWKYTPKTISYLYRNP